MGNESVRECKRRMGVIGTFVGLFKFRLRREVRHGWIVVQAIRWFFSKNWTAEECL